MQVMTGGVSTNRYRLISVLFAGSTLLYLASGAWNIVQTPILGVMFCPGYEVCRIYPASPAEAAGFHLGDKIRKVEGRPVEEAGPIGRGKSEAGDVRIYQLDRAGELIEVAVTLSPPSARSIYLRLGPSLIGLVFLCSGLYVFLRRPAHTSGVFYAFCLAVCWLLAGPPHLTGSFTRFLAGFMEIMAGFASASLLFYLFLIFPRPKRIIRAHPKLIRLLFVVSTFAAAILALELALTFVMDLTVPERVLVFLNYLAGSLITGYFILAAISFLHGYFTAYSAATKRFMRIILLGFLLGMAPVAVYSVLFAINPHLERPLEEHVFLFASLVPLGLGYSVLRLPVEQNPSANG
jgi:hypothetical protein